MNVVEQLNEKLSRIFDEFYLYKNDSYLALCIKTRKGFRISYFESNWSYLNLDELILNIVRTGLEGYGATHPRIEDFLTKNPDLEEAIKSFTQQRDYKLFHKELEQCIKDNP